MRTLASWLSGIKSSGTLAIKAKALELKKQGVEIIEFTAGEPDYPTPDKIKKAAIQAINDNFTYYTQTDGIPELKEAIIKKFKEDNQLHYGNDQVIVSAGAKHSLYECLMVLLNKGDEVILPNPYWVSYPEQIRMLGGEPKYIDTFDSGFKITQDSLKAALTPKTKAIIFNSPSNPTGAVYTKEELEALKDVLADKDLWIISDEIYEKIIFDNIAHYSLAQFEELYDKTIVINGFSKAYSMTGWRIGHAAGPASVIKEMKKIQGHQTSNVNSITQKGAVVGLNEVKDEIVEMCGEFQKRRDTIYEMFSLIKDVKTVKPLGAFYIFPDFSAIIEKMDNIENDFQLVEYFIEKAGVVAIPGSMFGAPGYIRFSYATSMDDIKKGISKIVELLK